MINNMTNPLFVFRRSRVICYITDIAEQGCFCAEVIHLQFARFASARLKLVPRGRSEYCTTTGVDKGDTD